MRALSVAAASTALVLAGCAGDRPSGGSAYLVPKHDPHVLAHTYDRMLIELARRRSDDPGDVLDGATPGQRMLYTMFFVDDEIANGGLYQVYWNLSGGFIDEAVRAADAVGAAHWASLVRRAGVLLFPEGVPDDSQAQRAALGCPDYCDKGIVDTLDDDWRHGELRRPLLRYVEAHPREFYADS